MSARKTVPPRNRIPKGTMAAMERPPGGNRPGPKPKQYRNTPTTPVRSTTTASSVGSPAGASQSPAWSSRLHPSLSINLEEQIPEPRTAPRTVFTGPTPAHLARPGLFSAPLPSSLQTEALYNTEREAERFLHTGPIESDQPRHQPVESWIDYNPDLRTPGLISTKNWLYENINIPDSAHYRDESFKIQELPQVFDGLVRRLSVYLRVPLNCSIMTTTSGLTTALNTPSLNGSRRLGFYPAIFAHVPFAYTFVTLMIVSSPTKSFGVRSIGAQENAKESSKKNQTPNGRQGMSLGLLPEKRKNIGQTDRSTCEKEDAQVIRMTTNRRNS